MRRTLSLCLPVLAGGLLACNFTPKPPKGVPSAAIYVPGDHGAKFFVHIERPHQLGWIISMYDGQGNRTSTGEYKLVGIGRAEIFANEMEHCDGKILRLKDGTLVVPKPQ